jgi:hypothetical protein
MPAPILERRKVALFKLETTYGVDAAPVGATDALLCVDVLLPEPLVQTYKDRKLVRSYLGAFQQITGGDFGKIEVLVEAAGFGAAGPASPTPALDALLQCIAFGRTINAGVSVAYAPISANIQSGSFYYYEDGVLHKFYGCRGDLDLSMIVNDIPILKFTLWGVYQPVTDVALPAYSVAAYQTPLLVNADNTSAVSVQGYAASLAKFDFKLGNKVEMRELVGGSRQVLITDRLSSGSVEMEAVKVGTKDFYAAIAAGTLGAFSVTHGLLAGNKWTFAAPNLQLVNPTKTMVQGIVHTVAALRFVPNAGNDEHSLTIL